MAWPRSVSWTWNSAEVWGIWLIEKLRRRDAQCPILVYTGEKQSEWEEEAYLRGVTHVLTKPVRGRLLHVLDRIFAAPAAPRRWLAPTARPDGRGAFYSARIRRVPSRAPPAAAHPPRFSSLLAHSFNAEAMLRQFLLLLREIVNLDRAAIFCVARIPWSRWRAAAGCAAGASVCPRPV